MFRQDFPYPQNFIYMNSGTMALTPKSVLHLAEEEKQIFENNPALGLFGAWEKAWTVQKRLAHYFNADPKDLFLRTNVTYVMNDFLLALDLPKGSEILISDIEYGAIVNICKFKAHSDGLEFRIFPTPKDSTVIRNMTAQDWVKWIEKSLSPKTSLVMLSHVTTGSGFQFPIEEIAPLLRQKNIIFAVDGAHGAGSIPLDFTKTSVDFYGTNLHKWMMGPKGTGFGWISKRLREKLKPRFAGWTSYEALPHFSVFGEGDHFTARWMICSTHDFSPLYAINGMIDYWEKNSFEKITSRQMQLRHLAQDLTVQKTGWISLSDFQSQLSGPLVAFQLPEKLSQKGFELMWHLTREKFLQVSMTVIQGNWCLRLAPHIYNTEEEIEKTAEILADL